jgi:hypothetical protein
VRGSNEASKDIRCYSVFDFNSILLDRRSWQAETVRIGEYLNAIPRIPSFQRCWRCSSIRPPTPPVDQTVASLASRLHVGRNTTQADQNNKLSDDDDDALFDELERDDLNFASTREERLEALKAEMVKARNMREADHGRLTEITDEKEIIKTSA